MRSWDSWKEKMAGFFSVSSRKYLAISLAVVTVAFAYYGWDRIAPEAKKWIASNEEYNQSKMTSVIGEILADDVVELRTPIEDTASGIRLCFATYSRMNDCSVSIEVYDDGGALRYSQQVFAEDLKNNKTRDFVFDAPISSLQTEYLEVVITSPDASAGNAVTLYAAVPEETESDTESPILYINGESGTSVLYFELLGERKYTSLWVLFGIQYVLSVAGLVGVYWILSRNKKPLEYGFLFAALLLGLISNFVFPTYSIPDEPAHFNTAYRYSNLLLGQGYETEDGDMVKRQEDVDTMSSLSYRPTKAVYESYFENGNLFLESGGGTLVQRKGDNVSYPFWGYLPGIVGLTIGRLLHLGTLPMLFFARLLSSCTYAVLLFFAIRKTPVGKLCFCLIGLLPMAIHLSASFSFDLMCIGMSFLLIAWILQLVYRNEQVTKKDFIGCAVLSFLLAPCKLVYTVLVFLCILIPGRNMQSNRKKWQFCAAMIVIGCVSVVLFNYETFVRVLEKQAGDTIGTGADGYNAAWILTHIGESLEILIRTVVEQTGTYWSTMLGSTLGWLDTSIHLYLLLILLVCLFLSAFPTGEERSGGIFFCAREKWLFFGVFFVGFLLTIMTMFVAWTPFGNRVVEGVQGRYFLPFLPLVLLLFRGKGIVVHKNVPQILLYTTITVTTIAFLESFAVIAAR